MPPIPTPKPDFGLEADTTAGLPAVIEALASGGAPMGSAPSLNPLAGLTAQQQAVDALNPETANLLSLMAQTALTPKPAPIDPFAEGILGLLEPGQPVSPEIQAILNIGRQAEAQNAAARGAN